MSGENPMITLTLPATMTDDLAQLATELATDTRPWRKTLGIALQGALFRASVQAMRTKPSSGEGTS